ncbi:MAG: hypothetical protein AAF699_18055 [Pseudomonadota bacterium]
MPVDRRTLLKTGAGAIAVLPNVFTGSLASAAGTAETLTSFLTGNGYQGFPQADLITSHSFNGSVAFDYVHDYHANSPTGEPEKWFVLQDCARVEDIAKKDKPGVLAYFHVLAFKNNAPAYPGELLDQSLEFLIRQVGFKPSRLLLVSTEKFRPFLKQLEPFDIAEEQVVFRKLSDARKAGDGSGFFSPKGYPETPKILTASFHYMPEGQPMPKTSSYPPGGYFEIGEYAFKDEQAPSSKAEVALFGVERMAMAQGKTAGDFSSSRKRLLARLEEEAERRDIALPKAYHDFSALYT